LILVDTSIWIDYLLRGDAILAQLLDEDRVLGHPAVIGELALGALRQRALILRMLRRLPQTIRASADEVLTLIETASLTGSGIGYVDAHLLAAARLTDRAKLWTRDRRLRQAAERLGVAASLHH